MKTVRELKKWISGCEEISRAVDDLEVLFDFAKEEEASEEEVEKQYQTALHLIEDLELKNMLRQEADSMSCVLKINSGAGGTGKSGLGFHVNAYVHALGRSQRLQKSRSATCRMEMKPV